MKKPSPLAKAEAALKDETAKKLVEKIVEKKAAAKAAVAPKPVLSKEVERKVPEKVMDPLPIEVPFEPEKEEPKVVTRALVGEITLIKSKPEKPSKPEEDQLCLVRRRGNVTLARYRRGEFYASHAGFYSELVDRPDAWIAVPEF